MAQLSKKNPVPLVISTQAPATIAQSSDTFTPSTAAFVQSLESIATFIKDASRPSQLPPCSSEYSQHCSEYDSENDSEHDSEYHSEYGSKYNSEYDSEYDSECSFEESSKKEVEGILTVNKEETSRKNGKKVAANESKADLAVGTLPEGVKNIRFGESTQVALSKNSLKPIHVFIDNSNILAGFTTYYQNQRYVRRNWYRTKPKLNYDALFRILEDGRNVTRKVLVASSPLSQSLTQAEQAGYEVSVLKRIEQKEQGVDEVLHLKILESLLDHHDPSILVLASGDGKDAEYFQGGFHKCVIKALERGWQVEVISWRHQLSHNFSNAKFLKQWKNFYQVIYLDRYAAELRL